MSTTRYPNLAKLNLPTIKRSNITGTDQIDFVVADDLEALLAKAPRVYSWGHQVHWWKDQARARDNSPTVTGLVVAIGQVEKTCVTDTEVEILLNTTVLEPKAAELFNRILEHGYKRGAK